MDCVAGGLVCLLNPFCIQFLPLPGDTLFDFQIGDFQVSDFQVNDFQIGDFRSIPGFSIDFLPLHHLPHDAQYPEPRQFHGHQYQYLHAERLK